MVALNMSAEAQQEWNKRLIVATTSSNHMRSSDSVINSLLHGQEWQSLFRTFRISSPSAEERMSDDTTVSTPRLDGHFQFCNIVDYDNHSPSDPTQPWPPAGLQFVYSANPCVQATKGQLKDKAVLISLQDANCTAEQAASFAIAAGATAAVVMVKPNAALQQLGQHSFEDHGLWSGSDTAGC